jgi:hypothetical protein
MKLQIRVEAINALNYTVLWNPNVDPWNATSGFINQDRNNPRDIQIGARFTSSIEWGSRRSLGEGERGEDHAGGGARGRRRQQRAGCFFRQAID